MKTATSMFDDDRPRTFSGAVSWSGTFTPYKAGGNLKRMFPTTVTYDAPGTIRPDWKPRRVRRYFRTLWAALAGRARC